MSPQSILNPSRALEGVHGVHVVPSSSFKSEETTQDGGFAHSTSGSSAIGINLSMQWVKKLIDENFLSECANIVWWVNANIGKYKIMWWIM